MSTTRIGTFAGGAARLFGAVGRQQEDFGVGVVEEEAELFFLVAGIERRGGAGYRRREKATIVGRPLGSAMPTRSPRRMPAAARPSASACTCSRNSP